MRLRFILLFSLLVILPIGCSYNPVNWFRSTPDSERFIYNPKGEAVGKKPGGGPERPEKALRSGPERPEEALITHPETVEGMLVDIRTKDAEVVEEEVIVSEGPSEFTFIFYARGPAGRTGKSREEKARSRVYREAKEAHMAHNVKEGAYGQYYQQIRNRIKQHWNFLYSDVDGINYRTLNNLPIIVDAVVDNSGIVGNVIIVENAGNPVLAALVKGGVETVLIDRFPRSIKDDYIDISLHWYFED